MGRIRVGVSGWDYGDWRGDFYPTSLPQADRLAYVGRHFDTVEVNATFYALASPETFHRWHCAVPRHFVFALKGSRYITHVKKLVDVEGALANFFASGLLELDRKLGPLLWQLPANLHVGPARLDAFLALLPHDTTAATRLARRHDDRVGRPGYGPGANHRIRHVLEVRHPDDLCAETATIARRHGVALTVSHAAAWPRTEEITAGFVYVRLHGPAERYASAYGDHALRRWAERLRRWEAGGEPTDAARLTGRKPPARSSRDVYAYLDNDAGGHAPREAVILRDLVAATP